MIQNELYQGLKLEGERKCESWFILMLKDLTAKNRKQSVPSLVPVINLNTELLSAYKISMCIAWDAFFFLEYFSFRSLLLCKHIWTVIIPFSAPGGSTCALAWESGPSGQTVFQIWEWIEQGHGWSCLAAEIQFPWQVKNSLAFTAETVLVLIYKRASLFVLGSCPGWVVGSSMLQAGIV